MTHLPTGRYFTCGENNQNVSLTNGMPIWTQSPNSTLDYTFSLAKKLRGTGDSIAHATFTPNNTLNVISTNWTDMYATGWISGGTVGFTYPITVHFVTLFGRQLDFTWLLAIAQT